MGNDDNGDWKIFKGNGEPIADLKLPDPPPWRDFSDFAGVRAKTFQTPAGIVETVNAALYLRRPVLVEGNPGTGKSSLAYAVAYELGLGDVLPWHINSRSTLRDGLYLYDAIGRLRQASLERAGGGDGDGRRQSEEIGRYIKLGPIGTAFVHEGLPRVVLIDEIDKSDIDLPNDLLHVFENGSFEIDELVRIADETPNVSVGVTDPSDPDRRVDLERGRVQCSAFPFIVITSNGERDLPPAFLRRCLRIQIPDPEKTQLRDIVTAHLADGSAAELEELLTDFTERQKDGALLATDQLLNAFFLVSRGKKISADERETLMKVLLKELG